MSVSVSGDTAIIGAYRDDDKGTDSGSAYVFRFSSSAGLPNGSPCSAPGQCLSGFCVDGVCCNTSCGGGGTGDCQACAVAAGTAVNGICGPLSASLAPTITCRPAVGECDTSESCSGTSVSCPPNLSQARPAPSAYV